MKITVTRLSSGYFHVRGEGPCNWAQPATWPCGEQALRFASFQTPSDEFIKSALKAMVAAPEEEP